MKAGFKLKAVKVTSGGFTYRTHRVSGWLDGRRIGKQFSSRDEAETDFARLGDRWLSAAVDGFIETYPTS